MPQEFIKKLVSQGKGSKSELEALWKKAKEVAKESGKEDNFAYITGIFKKMAGIKEHKIKSFKQFLKEAKIDVEELVLYMDNTSSIYKEILKTVVPKLKKLLKKGKIDRKKASLLFSDVVNKGAKGYEKEILKGGDRKVNFDKKTKKDVAMELANSFSSDIEEGNL